MDTRPSKIVNMEPAEGLLCECILFWKFDAGAAFLFSGSLENIYSVGQFMCTMQYRVTCKSLEQWTEEKNSYKLVGRN